MSWGAKFRLEAGQTEPAEGNIEVTGVDGVPEHLEQYREALSSVFGVLLSGVVGDPREKSFDVQLTGHGNPDHEPRDGYGNDFLAVIITQVSEETK